MSSISFIVCLLAVAISQLGAALGDSIASSSTMNDSPNGPVRMLPKIVGGTAAADGQFPYQVQLQINTASAGYMCGGTLVSSTFVVSAAHCFSGIGTIVSGTVYAGSAAAYGNSSHAQISQMASFWLHPQFSPATLQNDLAIITLASPFTFNSYVAAMSLAASSATFKTNISCTVSGWGATADGGSLSNTLMYASVNIVNQSKCVKSWSSLPSTAICTSTTTTDTCQGDAGGPVICNGTARDGTTRSVLAGIVSYGRSCASGVPAVNTRVSSYSDLIYDFTNSGGNSTATTMALVSTTVASVSTSVLSVLVSCCVRLF